MACINLILNRSSEIQSFKAIEICDGIMSAFYPGLPKIKLRQFVGGEFATE